MNLTHHIQGLQVLLWLWLCSSGVLLAANPDSENMNSAPTVQGLAVWNDALYIHSKDTLLSRGNLYLYDAEIQGEGTFMLTDTISQSIYSCNSTVSHLVIENTDTVTLHGDLRISRGLGLVGGVLDSRSASLSLADTAILLVTRHGEWLRDKEPLYWLPVLPVAVVVQQNVSLVAGISTALLERAALISAERRLGYPNSNQLPASIWKEVPKPPPRQLLC